MNKILFFLLLTSIVASAQVDSSATHESKYKAYIQSSKPFKVSFNIEMQALGLKNGGFLHEIYKPNLGYQVGTRFIIKGAGGLGFEYGKNGSRIKDNTLIGNFNNAEFKTVKFYGFFRYPINDKFKIEGSLGGGNLIISHKYNGLKYNLSYKLFNFGSNVYYQLTTKPMLELYFSIDGNSVKKDSQQSLPAGYENKFSKTFYTDFGLGVNFTF